MTQEDMGASLRRKANRVQRPKTTSRERVLHLATADKRLIDMLGYAYELGIRDAAIVMNRMSPNPLQDTTHD